MQSEEGEKASGWRLRGPELNLLFMQNGCLNGRGRTNVQRTTYNVFVRGVPYIR